MLIGKPFELADAQALLTLLEVALPVVLTKLAQRAAASLKDAKADKGVGGAKHPEEHRGGCAVVPQRRTA